MSEEIKLFYVAASGKVEAMEQLLQNGVNVNAVDYNGRSALHIAADRGHSELVGHLLERGAHVDCEDTGGHTPWCLAANRRHTVVMNLLRTFGAKAKNSGQSAKIRKYMLATFAAMEAFPRPIAMAMLEGRQVESITKSEVSVLFSDIVGFTRISSLMDSRKVSNLLSRLFHKLDRLAHIHGVQKIDVMGDAYIAATNFSEHQPCDHAARLARFALDSMRAAADTPVDLDNPNGPLGCLQLRAGIHVGPVSGSIVGLHCVKYTLVGDTVNIASRMESTGAPGRIQCSEAAAALLRRQADELSLRPRCCSPPCRAAPRAAAACVAVPPAARPGVDVQGKGRVMTYWVTSLRRADRNFGSCPDLLQLQQPHCRDCRDDDSEPATVTAAASGRFGRGGRATQSQGDIYRRAPGEDSDPEIALAIEAFGLPVTAPGRTQLARRDSEVDRDTGAAAGAAPADAADCAGGGGHENLQLQSASAAGPPPGDMLYAGDGGSGAAAVSLLGQRSSSEPGPMAAPGALSSNLNAGAGPGAAGAAGAPLRPGMPRPRRVQYSGSLSILVQ